MPYYDYKCSHCKEVITFKKGFYDDTHPETCGTKCAIEEVEDENYGKGKLKPNWKRTVVKNKQTLGGSDPHIPVKDTGFYG
mgnify:CR=1 FL=1